MSTEPPDFNAQIVAEFRAHHGRVGGDWEGWPLLLLHHTGARSGRHFINPLGFVSDDGRYVVCASNGGAPNNPDWYYNLTAHPDVTIEAGPDTIPVHASEASGQERNRLFRLSVEHAPQLGEYEKQAGRAIPVIVLTPKRRASPQEGGRIRDDGGPAI